MNARSAEDGELTVRGRKPFAMIPTDLVRDPGIGSSAIRLWTVLASYAYGSDVVTRPSRVALAKDCGYGSTRAVDLNLRQLERVGWLTIEPTRRADGGRGNNRYILEWEPRTSAPPLAPENRNPAADPTAIAKGNVYAGQAPAKTIALGSRAADGYDIHAGHTPAKIIASGSEAGDPPAKNSSLSPAKIIAPQRVRNQTQEQPPAVAGNVAAGPRRSGLDGGATTPGPVAASPTTSPADLAAAVKSALPTSLANQLGTKVLRNRCAGLAEAGWTCEQVKSATRARSWTGARGGAVVQWITELDAETPPVVADGDRYTTVELQLAARRERRAAIDAAVGSSDLRQEAVRVATQLAANSRARRRMELGQTSSPKVLAGRDQQRTTETVGLTDSHSSLTANGSFDPFAD